jgi:ribonucleotide reductase alpha subunit
MPPIQHVQKRDGNIVDFEQPKITEAIWKAAQSVGGTDRTIAEKIANQVTAVLEVFFKEESPAPSVEQIQDLVEKILIENGHAKTAKAYIIYREEHKKLRQKREEILGVERLKLTTLDGQNKQLGDFIILEIADDLEAIFEGMKEAVVIHQNGEKVCVNFSELRPRGESVKGHGFSGENQQAGGPAGFMKLYDTALSTINKAAPQPRPHGMLLNVGHPDIIEFLAYEQNNSRPENFTLMVEITEQFMQAVEAKTDFELINPSTNKVARTVSAMQIFEELSRNVRKNSGPKPMVIEYPEKQRKHSSIQVNLPFDDDTYQANNSKIRHQAQEIKLPPITA